MRLVGAPERADSIVAAARRKGYCQACNKKTIDDQRNMRFDLQLASDSRISGRVDVDDGGASAARITVIIQCTEVSQSTR